MESGWSGNTDLIWGSYFLALCGFLVVMNWRVPVLRNLALVNVAVEFTSWQLISALEALPIQSSMYYWFLLACAVNLIKALIILVFISFDIEYLRKTTIRLLVIFVALALIYVVRFIDQFVVGAGLEDSRVQAGYSIVIPALQGLALITLVAPAINRFVVLVRTKRSRHAAQPLIRR
ncbi:hypothetical protein [Echinimonas agarilytica]|uniref:Uncharacterized protein n=1 Tax=Echinimonas agarilytica TaxID=1215918 RepID=A0AA42B652_9GAMM|nr:hypothetical protein [Echinimonas agarilytica]MCM2678325.1 hypothetical protein [Echinimonas agarilytica]